METEKTTLAVLARPGRAMLKNQSESADRGAGPAARKGASDLYARGIETVLLVEDEDGVRTVARRILEKYNYSILDANTPDRALAIAAAIEEPIHLLLTDVVMPGMNGHELAVRLGKLRPRMQVLFMSGHGDAPERYGLAGPGRFLRKPSPRSVWRKWFERRSTHENRVEASRNRRPGARGRDIPPVRPSTPAILRGSLE